MREEGAETFEQNGNLEEGFVMAIENFPQHDSTWNIAQQKQGKERSHTQFKSMSKMPRVETALQNWEELMRSRQNHEV